MSFLPAEGSPETNDALDLVIAERPMRGNTVGIALLGVAGDLGVTHLAGLDFRGLDQGPADPAVLPRGLDIPPFNEWDGRGSAVGRIRPEIQLEEADDA